MILARPLVTRDVALLAGFAARALPAPRPDSSRLICSEVSSHAAFVTRQRALVTMAQRAVEDIP